MARWLVTISGKNIRKTSVEKLVKKMQEEFGEGASIHTRDATPPESRADRFSEAQSQISEGKAEMESLRDELQDWFDNLPEAFQQGDKGSQLEEAVSQLEEVIQQCEEAESASVDFPSMY